MSSQVEPASRGGRATYDWRNAPDKVKAPPRQNLNGQTVTIVSADILVPDDRVPWEKTRKGDKETKKAALVLKYDTENQVEYLSGFRFFKNDDGTMGSDPSFDRQGTNQVANLFRMFATLRAIKEKKGAETATLKDFMTWLNSRPKVLIEAQKVMNVRTGEPVLKNIPVRIA